MTLEELDALYDKANRLVVGRSVTAAGKALVFSSSDLDSAAADIAKIYQLTDEEKASIASAKASTAFASVQDTAAGLAGQDAHLDPKRALTIARRAIDGGNKLKALAAFAQGGTKAAEAAAAGGQLASKATIWGWVATAAYAAGTGSWFAYNLRLFNLAAYEARRVREGLPLPPAKASIMQSASTQLLSVASSASDGARAIGNGTGAIAQGAWQGGRRIAGAAAGLFRRKSGEPEQASSPPSDLTSESRNQQAPLSQQIN